ncbi:MAG: hypothetical protein NVS1B4_18990 [Gemmatimonadaceae bacterium]
MRHNQSTAREGFALVLTLFALVVIGALVAGVFLASHYEYQIGRNSLLQTRALTSAEYGQNLTAAQWNTAWNAMPAGQTVTAAYAPGDGSMDTVRITRLNNLFFWVASVGSAGSGARSAARRRTGSLLRLQVPQLNVQGALTSRGTVTVGGTADMSGLDSVPVGWNSCPPPTAGVAGVDVSNMSNVQVNGNCTNYSCLQGNPPANASPAAGDTSTYTVYGNLTWNDLASTADQNVSGVFTGVKPSYNADGSCKTTDPNNWGDPNRNAVSPGTCEGYFPIIYAPGNLSVNGQTGQGILLVGGTLSIQGGFSWYGPVISRGLVKLTGTGEHIVGGIMAANIVDSTTTSFFAGNAKIQYSSCAIASALLGSARVVRDKQRGWAELIP